MERSREIRKLYVQASELASQEVEARARKILKSHPNLNEFVMVMGRWFFTRKLGTRDHLGLPVTDGNDIIHDPLSYMESLSDFIDEWDDYLKITGEPMRFSATGAVRRDW